jgi:branched-subunit amino acid aminotransferase/4-amino-4-deoxychorismate lyase
MVLIVHGHQCCHLLLVGTQNTVGISPPDSALLFVICSPVGPYYPDGFKPVALHGTTEHVRACPGGPFRKMDRVIHYLGRWTDAVRYRY